MIKWNFIVSGLLAFGLGVLAYNGGAKINDSLVASAFLMIVFLILGFIICGLTWALRKYGGYLSAGIVAGFLLLWQSILPAVCVQAICNALGISD